MVNELNNNNDESFDGSDFLKDKSQNQFLRRMVENFSNSRITEEILDKTDSNLRTIFDFADVSYIFMSKDFHIASYNYRAESGYRKELKLELKPGLNLYNNLPEERKIIFKNRYKKVFSGKPLKYETSFIQKDNTVTWYSMHALPVFNKKSEVTGIILVTDNITDRKNAEKEREKVTEELIKRNAALEQFGYMVSHNLRSPVSNIIGLTDIILHSPNLNSEDFKKCVEGLKVSVKKLDEVIIDLSNITQTKKEKNKLQEIVNLPDLITDIKFSIKNRINENEVEINTHFEVIEIYGLKSYLNSICYNLISNSIKYKSPERKLIVSIGSPIKRTIK